MLTFEPDDLSPSTLGDAIKQALKDGIDLREIGSQWIDLCFPFDCGGLVPVCDGDTTLQDEDPPDFLVWFFYPCGLNDDEIRQVWNWYLSLPRQAS